MKNPFSLISHYRQIVAPPSQIQTTSSDAGIFFFFFGSGAFWVVLCFLFISCSDSFVFVLPAVVVFVLPDLVVFVFSDYDCLFSFFLVF
jgi:hypothetical protein